MNTGLREKMKKLQEDEQEKEHQAIVAKLRIEHQNIRCGKQVGPRECPASRKIHPRTDESEKENNRDEWTSRKEKKG